jgi:hypothetical protein
VEEGDFIGASWSWESARRTLTLEMNEHCRHRCTFALLGGVDFSLLLLLLFAGKPFSESDDLIDVETGTDGIRGCSVVNFVKALGECVRLCSSRPDDESQ